MNKADATIYTIEGVEGDAALAGLSRLAREVSLGEGAVRVAIHGDGFYDLVFSDVDKAALERAFTPKKVGLLPMVPQSARRAMEGLVHCLINSGGEKQAETRPGEEMFALFDVPADDMAKLTAELRRRVTGFRTGSARFANGSSVWFVHVRDDVSRYSALSGQKLGDLLNGRKPLLTVPSAGGLFFFSAGHVPGEMAFASFVELWGRAPALLGLDPEYKPQRDQRRLAIGHGPSEDGGQDDGGRLFVVLLDGVSFRDGSELSSPLGRDVDVEFMPLADTRESLNLLADSLARADPGLGYELELREGLELPEQYTGPRIARLRRRRMEIEEELLRLQRNVSSQRILMRFSHRRLREMARALLKLSPLYLRSAEPDEPPQSAEVRYAFEAYRDGYDDGSSPPAGYHYLLINHPASALAEPLFDWALGVDDPDDPVVFESDPVWTPIYGQSQFQGGVFTPKGMALHPVLHAWDRADMREYLRDVLGRWLGKQHPDLSADDIERRIPEAPLIVCVRQKGAGRKLRFEVLDELAFEKLETKLDWINRNVEFAEALVGSDPAELGFSDILDLASRHADDGARRQFEEAVAEGEAAFEARSRHFAAFAAHELGGVRAAMTRQYNDTARQLDRHTTELRRMHRQIVEIIQVMMTLNDETPTAKDLHVKLLAESARMEKFTNEYEQRITNWIRRGEEGRVKAEEAASSLRALARKIKGMRGWRW
jgi:hypothetical protein